MSAISVFKCNLTRNSRVRKWIFLESHYWIKWEKENTAVWCYPAIDEIDDVDAKQYHRASFSTRNSALNTSLRKPIRMQDFIQLCDSNTNCPGRSEKSNPKLKIQQWANKRTSWPKVESTATGSSPQKIESRVEKGAVMIVHVLSGWLASSYAIWRSINQFKDI